LGPENLDPKVASYLDKILQGVALILEEAHQFRKPIAGPEDVDMEELVGSIVGQVEMMSSADIEFRCEKDLLPVYGIERQISVAIYSVIQNAIKAVAGEGRVTVEINQVTGEKGQKLLRIVISDTGCGIEKDKLNSIFEYGTSYWPDRRGTGYGLWRSRSIIQSIGGRIHAHSLLGQGSTFTILLPTLRRLPEDERLRGS
jgi:signal transduction histidine kinase